MKVPGDSAAIALQSLEEVREPLAPDPGAFEEDGCASQAEGGDDAPAEGEERVPDARSVLGEANARHRVRVSRERLARYDATGKRNRMAMA